MTPYIHVSFHLILYTRIFPVSNFMKKTNKKEFKQLDGNQKESQWQNLV